MNPFMPMLGGALLASAHLHYKAENLLTADYILVLPILVLALGYDFIQIIRKYK